MFTVESLPGGKGVTKSVLDVDDVEWTRVTLAGNDSANSPQVTASSDHAQISSVKLDEVNDFAAGNVQLNGIIDFDQRIRVANGAAIMGGDEWHTLGSHRDFADLAQFVLKFKKCKLGWIMT